jgi:hypothetical protein
VQAVTDKIAAGDPLEEIELARKAVSDLELAINQAIESLAVAIRGEETARSAAIVEVLSGAAVDEAALLRKLESTAERADRPRIRPGRNRRRGNRKLLKREPGPELRRAAGNP